MPSFRYLLCYLLVALLSSPVRSQDSSLVWKFGTGDEHTYRLTQEFNLEITLNATGRKLQASVRQVLDLTWLVDQVDEQGTARVVQTINRFRMEMLAPGEKEMKFDSEAKDGPAGFAAMLAPLAKALLTEPIVLQITPKGEVKAVEIPEAVSETMSRIPGAKRMSETLTPEGLQELFRRSLPTFPASAELTPEKKWTTKSKSANAQLGTLQSTTTYQYQGPRELKDKTLETVSYNMQTNFLSPPEGMQIEVTSQESNGEILFNQQAGLMHSNNLLRKLELNLTNNGQAITQKMSHRTVFDHIEASQPTE